MKKSEIYGILATVWIAPIEPNWFNYVAGAYMIYLCIREGLKEI